MEDLKVSRAIKALNVKDNLDVLKYHTRANMAKKVPI